MAEDFTSQLEALLFTNGTKGKSKYKISLETTQICVQGEGENEKKARKINYEDIIGVSMSVECSKASNGDSSTSDSIIMHTINIYAYPSTKNRFSSKCSRKRLCVSLGLNCLDTPDKNKRALQILVDSVNQRLPPRSIASSGICYLTFIALIKRDCFTIIRNIVLSAAWFVSLAVIEHVRAIGASSYLKTISIVPQFIKLNYDKCHLFTSLIVWQSVVTVHTFMYCNCRNIGLGKHTMLSPAEYVQIVWPWVLIRRAALIVSSDSICICELRVREIQTRVGLTVQQLWWNWVQIYTEWNSDIRSTIRTHSKSIVVSVLY